MLPVKIFFPRMPVMKLWQLSFRPTGGINDTLPRSAVVFSPHFDDETLGCGGTIIRKKMAGARVKIVFMTDGSKSHLPLISSRELSGIRKAESVAAAQKLGLEADDLLYLDFEERQVSDHQQQAVQKVEDLLEQLKPQQVFVPCGQDSHVDHRATNAVVMKALHDCPVEDVFEYPVWFWRLWPWVRLPLYTPRAAYRLLKSSLLDGWFGLRLIREFRWHTHIKPVLDAKQAALNEYVSQMTRLREGSKWAVLSDVADGDFLRCFFHDYEVFRKVLLHNQSES